MLTTNKIPGLVEKQKSFFQTQQTKKTDFRLKNLNKLYKLIKENEKTFSEALYADLKKPEFESYTAEIGFVLDEIKLHIKKLNSWSKPHNVMKNLVNPFAQSAVFYEPYGTVLIVAPWNYPFQLLLSPLIGALSAGNTAILKGAEYAPNTVAAIANTINNNFPPEYLVVTQGGTEMNQALLHEKFDYIFFTGSPRLGQIVMESAAKYLTPLTLELGGKSPTIVDYDANVELAAKRIIWGKYMNAGQTCVSPDYLFVHEKVKDEFIAQSEKYIKEFYGKNIAESKDYARIINQHHFNRILSLVGNAEILFGGNASEENLYIEPTFITGVTDQHPVMQEEIFGPILPVLTFGNLSEVIRYVNTHPRPLALYYFSNDKNKQNRIIKETSSGGICINDVIMQLTNPKLPFGGVGNSGIGSYHGRYSFETFSHKKAVLKQSNFYDIPLRYPPYTKEKLRMAKFIIR